MPVKPCPPTIVTALAERFGPGVIWKIHDECGQTQITVDPDAIIEILKFLKELEICPFEQLSDITAIDLSAMPGFDPETGRRFVVCYNVYSMTRNVRLFLRAPLHDPAADGSPDLPEIKSTWGVYKSGFYTEREVYEMYGIRFLGHPNHKRLLTPEYFDEAPAQYPLRKDYPLRGRGDRGEFPVYDPEEELNLTRYGFASQD